MSASEELRRLGDRLAQGRDQNTAHIRDEYLRLDKASRSVLKEWIDKIAIAGPVPFGIGVNLSLTVHMEVCGVNEQENIAVSPQTLAKAVAAWDQEEGYVHRGLEF